MIISKLSPKQKKVFRWCYKPDNYALICDGSVRSGKTVAMSCSYILWAMKCFDGMNFGICGNTVQAVERNIISVITQMNDLRYYFSMKYIGGGKHRLTVTGGGKENYFYVFGGKDEASYKLVQGITLAGVFFDEVALMPESFVNQAIARTISVEGARIWFNCNPDSPNHWFYKNWILKANEKNAIRIHFHMNDNPIMTPEKIARTESMFQGVFYQRYVLGDWVIAEGLVYPMFDVSKNVTSEEFEMKPVYYVASDYGTQNATVFLLWHKTADGRWICEKEYYYSGRNENVQKTDEEYCDDLIEFLDGIQLKGMIVDPSAASFIEALKRRGIIVIKAKNDVINGIRYTGTLIHKEILLFRPCCQNTIQEFGLYSWDSDSEVDEVIKKDDHAMDAMRYFCYTHLATSKVGTSKLRG